MTSPPLHEQRQAQIVGQGRRPPSATSINAKDRHRLRREFDLRSRDRYLVLAVSATLGDGPGRLNRSATTAASAWQFGTARSYRNEWLRGQSAVAYHLKRARAELRERRWPPQLPPHGTAPPPGRPGSASGSPILGPPRGQALDAGDLCARRDARIAYLDGFRTSGACARASSCKAVANSRTDQTLRKAGALGRITGR